MLRITHSEAEYTNRALLNRSEAAMSPKQAKILYDYDADNKVIRTILGYIASRLIWC